VRGVVYNIVDKGNCEKISEYPYRSYSRKVFRTTISFYNAEENFFYL
jgi:hypothetical protein